jgi:hypothetical protein
LFVVKGDVVMLRISTQDKTAIKEAAERRGKSLTTFITEAAVKQARAAEPKKAARLVHGGVPSWFRGTCFEAAQGGTSNYSHAGYKLARSLGSVQPWEAGDDEWTAAVEQLKTLIDNDNEDAVWDWFAEHVPKFVALIPSRRRDQFLAGIYRAREADEIIL